MNPAALMATGWTGMEAGGNGTYAVDGMGCGPGCERAGAVRTVVAKESRTDAWVCRWRAAASNLVAVGVGARPGDVLQSCSACNYACQGPEALRC